MVFDIGSVLEVIDESVFPAPFEDAARLGPGRRRSAWGSGRVIPASAR